jgi:hypothetical protein
MSYRETMTFIAGSDVYSVGLINETAYNPDSADNVMSYKYFYSDRHYCDYLYLTRHGIHVFNDGELVHSACICSSGGTTGIHPTCSILEENHLLVCCANSVFCLTFPALKLLWMTKADNATCLGIFKQGDDYIVHGELEISRLNRAGNVIWRFSGSDIFTTPTGKDDFILEGNKIKAKNWEGIEFVLDARTGGVLRD